MMRSFAEEFFLHANTLQSRLETDYSIDKGKRCSNIDYGFFPLRIKDQLIKVSTMQHIGYKLQLASTLRRDDHIPVMFTI